MLVSNLMVRLISGCTKASGNNILLIGLCLFLNSCGHLFLFLEHNIFWQYALFCHNYNILVRVSFFQDLSILWDLLVCSPWAFASALTSHCYADSEVCNCTSRTGYFFEMTFWCWQAFSLYLLPMPQAFHV